MLVENVPRAVLLYITSKERTLHAKHTTHGEATACLVQVRKEMVAALRGRQ